MKLPCIPQLRLLLASGLLFSAVASLQAQRAFPGAIGFGTQSPIARDGAIYEVTNLDDTGPGSLRYGLEHSSNQGPRVIVFRVSGVIALSSNLKIRNATLGDYGNVWIAGQTAPWPGITLRGAGLVINASNVLVQHIAIRPGNFLLDDLDNIDCIGVGAPVPISNVVIDHVSMSWALDETASVWTDLSTAHNVTFSNCIFSHPIQNGEVDGNGNSTIRSHPKGTHGYGPLVGRGASYVTLARNIMAFCWGRNPLVRDETGGAQVVNNLVYRPGYWPGAVVDVGDLERSPHRVSIIGNIIRRHPTPFSLDKTELVDHDSDTETPEVLITTTENYPGFYETGIRFQSNIVSTAGAYLSDNLAFNPNSGGGWYPTGNPPDPWDSDLVSGSGNITHLSSDPYDDSGGVSWTPWSADDVQSNLVGTTGSPGSAGKFSGNPDPIDAALLQDIRQNGGAFLERFSDLGSNPWSPANLENEHTLEIPNDPHTVTGNGYTNLENWLHGLAAEVEGSGGSDPIDPPAVFDQDFADGNADGWTPDGGSWSVVSQVYRQTDETVSSNRSVLTGTNWTDQVIAADVNASAISGSNRFFGVVARYRTPGDYYYLVLRTNNTVELKKLSNGSVTPLDSGAYTVALNTTYRLVLEAVGSTLRGYVNGTLVTEATDSEFASGQVGLLTYFADVGFDDVVAHPNQSDFNPPTVAITAPADNATVSASVNVTANASDDVGIVGVQFRLDGSDLGAEDTVAPYGVAWDTTTATNGGHTLTAVARDAFNTTTSTAVDVTVSNGGGTSSSYEEDFADGVAQDWSTVAGTWSVASGYFQQTANDYPDIAVYDGGSWATDFTYAASLRTSWSATNNRVGMIYNYVDADNYTYVIFNAAGLAEINRVINGGSPVVVASASYSGGGSGVWFDVELTRSGSSTTVEVNGSPVFSNVSQTELGAGRVGLITRFNASARFDDISVTTAESAAVFDTFEDGNANGWTDDGGTWSIVGDGTNVLRQSDSGTISCRAVIDATAGWTDQVVEADVKAVSVSGSNRFFGVVARYVDADNYYYFVLRTNGTIELKKLVAGSPTTLDSGTFAVNTGTWYSLKLEVNGSTLRGYVNGGLQLEATDPEFASGQAGVLAYYTVVSFDDVYADTNEFSPVLVAETFEDGTANGWTPNSTSSWSVVTDGSLAYRQNDTSGLALSSVGNASWTDQIIELEAKALSFNFDTSNDRWFGLMARYTDANNYYYVTIRTTNEIQLRRMVNGSFTTLATAPLSVSTGTWYVVKFKAVGDSLKVYVDGELKLQAVDSALTSGQPGLIMYKGSAVYDDVVVTKP